MFGRSSADSARTLRKTYGVEAPQEIASTVTSAQRGGDRLWLISLGNGQVWRQAESESFALREGDSVEIEAGFGGAYYLRRNGQGRAIRVKRVR